MKKHIFTWSVCRLDPMKICKCLSAFQKDGFYYPQINSFLKHPLSIETNEEAWKYLTKTFDVDKNKSFDTFLRDSKQLQFFREKFQNFTGISSSKSMKEDFLYVVVNFIQSLQNQGGNKTKTAETLAILDEDSSQQLDSSTQNMIPENDIV